MNRRGFMRTLVGGAAGSIIGLSITPRKTRGMPSIGPPANSHPPDIFKARVLETGQAVHEYGPYVEVFQAGRIKHEFDIRYIYFDIFVGTGIFLLSLYAGEEEICQVAIATSAGLKSAVTAVYMHRQPAGTEIKARLRSSQKGIQVVSIRVEGGTYG